MKLSFVIPAYNAEKFIQKCVQSIVHQDVDYKNYEIIVVNDGSKDGTEQICLQLQKEYPMFRCFTNANHGPGYTRNYGIRKAKGEYIWCVDSDDFLEEGVLPQIFEELLSSKPMYLMGFQHINESGDVLRKVNFGSETLTPAEFLSRGNYVNYVWCRIVAKSLFEKQNIYFREDLMGPEDFHLTFRLMSLVEEVKCIDLITYNYIVNPVSLMNSRSESHMQRLAEATLAVGKDLRGEWERILETKKKTAFDGWLSNYLYGFLFSLYRFQYSPGYIRNVIKQLRADNNYPIRVHTNRKKQRAFMTFANKEQLFVNAARIRRLFG